MTIRIEETEEDGDASFRSGADARSRRRHVWRTGCGQRHAVVGVWLCCTPTPRGNTRAGACRCPGATCRARRLVRLPAMQDRAELRTRLAVREPGRALFDRVLV